MADDDQAVGADDEFEEETEEDGEPAELTDEDLDEEALVEDDEFGEIEDPFDADAETDVEGEDDAATEGPVRKSVTAEDEDEDDDIIAPDDVEADLDTILKDRLVAADDEGGEDEEDEPEDRSESSDRLQPKRADEQLCPSCFLLVRNSAPICPVGDDECPLFS
ncbi:MAG: hypothetical protein ABI894_13040 [Ilumatobacteraceae bacterium]